MSQEIPLDGEQYEVEVKSQGSSDFDESERQMKSNRSARSTSRTKSIKRRFEDSCSRATEKLYSIVDQA